VASRGQQALAERRAHLASRKREVLEAFDLATLNLVATMRMGKDRVAMIEDGADKGYIVRRGNHMGTKTTDALKKSPMTALIWLNKSPIRQVILWIGR